MRKWIPICGAVIASLALTSIAEAQLQASYKVSGKRPNLRMKLTGRKVHIKQPLSGRRPDLGFQHLGIVRHKPKLLKLNTGRGVLTTSLKHQKKFSVSHISTQFPSPKEEGEK